MFLIDVLHQPRCCHLRGTGRPLAEQMLPREEFLLGPRRMPTHRGRSGEVHSWRAERGTLPRKRGTLPWKSCDEESHGNPLFGLWTPLQMRQALSHPKVRDTPSLGSPCQIHATAFVPQTHPLNHASDHSRSTGAPPEALSEVGAAFPLSLCLGYACYHRLSGPYPHPTRPHPHHEAPHTKKACKHRTHRGNRLDKLFLQSASEG